MMVWWQGVLLGIGAYWFIGVMVLKFLDPWDFGKAIPKLLEPPNRNTNKVWKLILLGWFAWPLELLCWRRKK
jgi:hypothetical protein